MSGLEHKILELKWDDANKRFELKLDDGSILYIPEGTAEKMVLDIPKPSEELCIRYYLAKINQIRIERLLNIEEIDKHVEDCMKRSQQAQDALKKATDKQETWNWTGVIKGILAEKALQEQKRHLTRLLFTEEGYYMTLLAKQKTTEGKQ